MLSVRPIPAPTAVESAEVPATTAITESAHLPDADGLGEALGLALAGDALGEPDASGSADSLATGSGVMLRPKLGVGLGAASVGSSFEPMAMLTSIQNTATMTSSTTTTTARRRQYVLGSSGPTGLMTELTGPP